MREEGISIFSKRTKEKMSTLWIWPSVNPVLLRIRFYQPMDISVIYKTKKGQELKTFHISLTTVLIPPKLPTDKSVWEGKVPQITLAGSPSTRAKATLQQYVSFENRNRSCVTVHDDK